MSKQTDSNSPRPERQRLRGRMRSCLGGLLLILLGTTGLFLWFAWRPKLPASPVHLTRDANGQLRPAAGDSGTSGVHLELNAATMNSSNQFGTTASESRSSGARLACHRMAIVNTSDHLLMQRVGAALPRQLKDLHGFEQVDYYPHGEKPKPGALAPDLVVTLRLAEKLGQQLPRKVVPEPGELESLGFAKLTPGTVIERELGLEQGALFYARTDDRFTTFLVRVVQQKGDDKPIYAPYHMTASDGSRSWGTGSLDRSSHIDGLGSVHFHAEPLDAAPRFKLSVEVDVTASGGVSRS